MGGLQIRCYRVRGLQILHSWVNLCIFYSRSKDMGKFCPRSFILGFNHLSCIGHLISCKCLPGKNEPHLLEYYAERGLSRLAGQAVQQRLHCSSCGRNEAAVARCTYFGLSSLVLLNLALRRRIRSSSSVDTLQ